MNEMRKLMETVRQLGEAGLTTRTFAFYEVLDDYGLKTSELPTVVVSVESTGDEKEDEKRARQLGVENGIPDLNTGFLVAKPYYEGDDDLLVKLEKAHKKYKKLQEIFRTVQKAKPNTVTTFWDNE